MLLTCSDPLKGSGGLWVQGTEVELHFSAFPVRNACSNILCRYCSVRELSFPIFAIAVQLPPHVYDPLS